MSEMIQALTWFWAPAFLFIIGMFFVLTSSSSKLRRLGKVWTVLSFIVLAIGPYMAPHSDSTASSLLMLQIMGPIALTLSGLYLLAFSGNVAVGQLSRVDRMVGLVTLVAGAAWFVTMHFFAGTPLWHGEVNPYWLVFWPTALLVSTGLASGAGISLLLVGVEREKESRIVIGASSLLFFLTVLSMLYDGHLTTAEEFRSHLWFAASDILGTMVGAGAAVLVFAGVIWRYESGLPEPKSILPPSNDDLEFASKVISSNIGGEEE